MALGIGMNWPGVAWQKPKDKKTTNNVNLDYGSDKGHGGSTGNTPTAPDPNKIPDPEPPLEAPPEAIDKPPEAPPPEDDPYIPPMGTTGGAGTSFSGLLTGNQDYMTALQNSLGNTNVNLDYGSDKGHGGYTGNTPTAPDPNKIPDPEPPPEPPPEDRDKPEDHFPAHADAVATGVPSIVDGEVVDSTNYIDNYVEEEYSGVPSIVDGEVVEPIDPDEVIPPVDVDPLGQLYQDLMSKHDESWQNQEDIARAQAASEGRKAAEMAAGMGAAVGGGTFAAGQAQAGLKGRELMMDARRQHDMQGLELRMTHLLNQLKVAEAAKDRDLQERLQNLINNTALDIEMLRAGHPPEIDGESSPGGGGGTGAGNTEIVPIPPGENYPYQLPGTNTWVGSLPGGRLTPEEQEIVNQSVTDLLNYNP